MTTETHPLHQKNAELGNKIINYGKEVLLEDGDAADIEVGEKITLMKWGNAVITNKETIDGKIHLTGELKLDDTDFKKTKKITWITNDPSVTFELTLVELDHIITKKKVEDEESVKDIVNYNSRIAYTAIGEHALSNVKQGDYIQLERRGYFFVDKLAEGDNLLTLNFIPDGKSSNMSKIKSKLDQKEVAGGKVTDKQKEQAAEKAKAAAATATGPDGEVKLSKKELNKLKKKEGKQNAKTGNPAPADKPANNAAPTVVASAGLTAEATEILNRVEL